MPPLDVLGRRWLLLGGFCGAFPFPYLYYTRLIPERQAENAKKYAPERRKSGLVGRFRDRMGRCWYKFDGNTLFFDENGPKLIVLMQK